MEKLLREIYSSEKKKLCLRIMGTASVYITAIFFGLSLLVLVLDTQYVIAVKLAAAAAIGFVAVTIVRKLINAPRPYELYSFYEVKPKSKTGESFPSRHCYSAFVISVLTWAVHPAVSCALLILAVTVALTRTLLGIHFVRDVVCGALIGVLTGVVGLLTVYFL